MIYEDKIVKLIKSKIKINTKKISITEAEKIISNFQKSKMPEKKIIKILNHPQKIKLNQKKLVKSNQ